MAHFAELDENNIVLRVLVVDNEQESRGQEFLAEDLGLGGRWEKTSYTSKLGKKVDPNTGKSISSDHFRYNFAGIGSFFYPNVEPNGAFSTVKRYNSWVLNTDTYDWEPPIPMPETGGPWDWNEELGDWQQV